MLYNGVFGCHGNTCYVIFIGAIFILYIVQVKSMCVPILRSIGSELTKLENMQQLYILFDVTLRKNGTSYVMGTTNTSDRYFDKEHFETNQKSLRLPVQKLWLK